MSDCIFCDLVAGSAPAGFVHRDELVSAFLDIRPVSPGHLLVIPNDHVVFTHDLPDATADRLFAVARRLARSLRSTDTVRAGGTNLFVADGEAAEQQVFHAHLHVIPRFPGDGFEIDAAAWRGPQPTREDLERHAERIRAALGSSPAVSPARLRPLVIGVAIRDEQVLAIEGFDHHTDEVFYRAPGGGIARFAMSDERYAEI